MFTKILTSSLLFLIALGGFFVSYDTHNIYFSTTTNAAFTGPCQAGQVPGDTGCIPAGNTESESKWLNESIKAVNAALLVISTIAAPAIIFASWLMSPDWTSGDLFGLREHMHKMWIIVSNIVYFIYAILLILIALATIFGKDNFNYKSMLPKLALGILMVPFTWWFVQWTISLAAVVTAQVITIPMETMKNSAKGNEYIDTPVIPKTHWTITTEIQDKSSKTESSSVNCGKDGNSTYCMSIRQVMEDGGGMYASLLLYAYDVFKLQEVKHISGELSKIRTAGQLLNELLIGAIMFLVFGLLVMALIAMLLLRAIKLWMYAIFSPIFTLHFVAGKELFGKGTEGFDLKEFIGLCFVPAVVGITLSFGLLIIAAVRVPDNPTDSKSSCDESKLMITDLSSLRAGNNTKGGCTIMTMFGNPKNKIIRGVVENKDEKGNKSLDVVNIVQVAGLNFVFVGKAKNTPAEIISDIKTANGGIDAAGGIFGTIIVNIIALIFIWMAFMAGKGVSKAVGVAVEPFEALGKKVGSMAASIPKYTPLPIPGGSLAGASKAIGQLESIKEQAMDKRYRESELGKLVQSMDPSSKISDELNAAAIRLKTDSGNSLATGLKKVLDESTGKQIIYNRTIQDGLDNAIKRKPTHAELAAAGFSDQHAKKMIEVMNDTNLTPDEKRVLLAAIAKSSTPSTITIGKGEVSKWKATLEGQGGTSSSSSGGGTTGTGYTATVLTNDKERMQVTIENVKFDTKLDGSNIKALSDTEKTNIKEIMKKVTEEEFKEKFSGLSEDAVKNIIRELKNQGGIFKT